MFYLQVCVCTACVPGVQGHEKRALGPLTLELRMVVSHPVDTGNQTQVICEISNCS